jgi:thiol-disulfide isomerase/thioredoxin
VLFVFLGCISTAEKQTANDMVAVKNISNETQVNNFTALPKNISDSIAGNYSFNDEFAYFYSSKCSACKEISPLFGEIKGNFSIYANFSEYDVTTKDGFAVFKLFLAKHNITKAYVPTIIIGNKILVGLDKITRANMYSTMFSHLNISGKDLNNG